MVLLRLRACPGGRHAARRGPRGWRRRGPLAAPRPRPEPRPPRRPALAPTGIVTAALGLAGVTYGLIELGRNGWTDAASLAVLGAGLAALVLFYVWETRAARPLVDL